MTEPERPPDGRSAEELDALLLGAPRRWTRDEVTRMTGVPLERARRYWRALGFTDTAGAVVFTDRDVDALLRLDEMVRTGAVDEEMAVALLRALGRTTAHLAGWQVDVVLEQLSGGTGLRAGLTVEEAYTTAERLLPELEPLLSHVWRLQLAAQVDRVLSDDDTMVDAQHLTVAFADIVGFTRLSRRLSERELAHVVERFEDAAADVVAAAGSRVVKTLGDEVLFIADRPGEAAQAALDLHAMLAGDEAVPELRIGMATGLVIARMGDIYGTTVNLASRLTAIARPGSVVVDVATVEDLADDPRFETVALWPRPVRGLGLVEPYALTARRAR